jgi:hypothetical protein
MLNMLNAGTYPALMALDTRMAVSKLVV